MELTITLQYDNAAFDDFAGHEVARILRELADRFADRSADIVLHSAPHAWDRPLFDRNGNQVGLVERSK